MWVGRVLQKEVVEMVVVAVQTIYQPGFTQEIVLPPNPRTWVKAKTTCVRIVGVETLPQEFLLEAEANGWRFHPETGKFYPTE